MGKGHDYELLLKNNIIESTDPYVEAVRPDYSGNSKHSVADVRITHDPSLGDGELEDVYVEAKKRSTREGMRKRVMSGSSKGETGLDELFGLVTGAPPWATTKVMIKFDRREAIIFDADLLYRYLTEEDFDYKRAERHGARLTPNDSISMVKPTLDNWASSTSGVDDHIKLMTESGVRPHSITELDGTDA